MSAIKEYYNFLIEIYTVSAHIPRRRLIKNWGFYGEILLNKTLSNWHILLNKVLAWRFNQEWPLICVDTVSINFWEKSAFCYHLYFVQSLNYRAIFLCTTSACLNLLGSSIKNCSTIVERWAFVPKGCNFNAPCTHKLNSAFGTLVLHYFFKF